MRRTFVEYETGSPGNNASDLSSIDGIPAFMMLRQGFQSRWGGPRGRADRPYHVALEDTYIRAQRGGSRSCRTERAQPST